MRTMFQLLRQHLGRGEALVLVTVTAASGAVPRGTGARMLVGSEGRIWGTIGGGAVEFRATQCALQVLQEGTSSGHHFPLHREDVESLGMICGGEVEVFFTYLPASDRELLTLSDQAEAFFAEGHPFWLLCDLHPGGTIGLYRPQGDCSALPRGLPEPLERRPTRYRSSNRDIFAEQMLASERVYVFGCGHVAQELVPVLAHVGFRCVALDDRPEFADPALFPGAEEVRCIDFARISDFVSIHPEDYVCIMTRGHAHDTAVQAQVLQCRPTYVGVIGSRQKAAGVRKLLQEDFGLTEEELNLVTTPIGLAIGAKTPAEIAISIAAQMISHRAQGR